MLQINLARQSDTPDWTNILFIIVLAIFWLVGGVIKAKASKSEAAKRNNITRKPARKPPPHSKEAREQMLSQLQRPTNSAQTQRPKPKPATEKPRMKFADLQAAVRKFATEAEQAFQENVKGSAPKLTPKAELPKPDIQSERLELADSVTPATKGLQEKPAETTKETPESEYLSDILTDYTNPEELKRAILHYEILGKPLALRDPFEEL